MVELQIIKMHGTGVKITVSLSSMTEHNFIPFYASGCPVRFFNKIRGLLTITEISFDADNIITLCSVSVFFLIYRK